MAYPLTDTGKLARRYGISYACAKYRLANGIPLDAPTRRNGNAKAWDSRGRTMAELEAATGLARSTIKHRIAKGIPLDAPKMSQAEICSLGAKARREMIAAGTFKKRKYRTDPLRLERPLELRVKARKPVNPFARMVP